MNQSIGIGLFVYNRPKHVSQVLDGLKCNAVEHLYIFSDAAKNDASVESVEEVRKLIHGIKWCQTTIIEQPVNLGLDNSIRYGIEEMFRDHSRVVVLEDDCVPLPSFLSYMRACFDEYENFPQVMNINACGQPFAIPKSIRHDAYFSDRISSWGWGTWKDRWALRDDNKAIILDARKGTETRKKIDATAPDLIPLLQKNYDGLDDNWDIYWATSVILNNGICVTPVKSHIRLIGLDGSGMHSIETDFFNSIPLCLVKTESFDLPGDLRVKPEIRKRFLWVAHGRKTNIALYYYNKVRRYVYRRLQAKKFVR